MTEAEKITIVQALANNDPEATNALVGAYLAKAKSAILRRRYPFGMPANAEVEEIYEMLQCELATRYFFRRGTEGEVVHSESEVSREYKSPNDEDLLMEVTTYAKLI